MESTKAAKKPAAHKNIVLVIIEVVIKKTPPNNKSKLTHSKYCTILLGNLIECLLNLY